MTDYELMTLNRCPECLAYKDGKCSVDFGWIRRLCAKAFAAGRRVEQMLNERDAVADKCETCRWSKPSKRVGFKKLFVDVMLGGNSKQYAELTERYIDELQELNRFDFQRNWSAWARVMAAQSTQQSLEQYRSLTYELTKKVTKLDLSAEQTLVAECQAHLTSYDDFIFGLRANQALFEEQKRAHSARLAALQAAYDRKVQQLRLAAERVGLLSALSAEMERLELADGAILALAAPDNDDL